MEQFDKKENGSKYVWLIDPSVGYENANKIRQGLGIPDAVITVELGKIARVEV